MADDRMTTHRYRRLWVALQELGAVLSEFRDLPDALRSLDVAVDEAQEFVTERANAD